MSSGSRTYQECAECGDEFIDYRYRSVGSKGRGRNPGLVRYSATTARARCRRCREGMRGVVDVVTFMQMAETRARQGQRWRHHGD